MFQGGWVLKQFEGRMDLSKIFFGLNNEYYLFPKQNNSNFDNVIKFWNFRFAIDKRTVRTEQNRTPVIYILNGLRPLDNKNAPSQEDDNFCRSLVAYLEYENHILHHPTFSLVGHSHMSVLCVKCVFLFIYLEK